MTPIDDIVEYALSELLSGSDRRRRALVRNLCGRWPDQPALEIVFALTSAASRIEDNLDRESSSAEIATYGYRLAALLAADVFAVESMRKTLVKADDLLHFWRRVDPYFLEL